MKIDTKYSLKPFGSGTSCLDTIDGECKRGLTVEQCIEICEKSDACACGLHVDMKDRNPSIDSYCLPLNTIQYKNRPLATSLISTSNNGTILSKENNVDITFFREEDMFPSIEETFEQLKSDLIFNNDIISIQIQKKKEKRIQLQSIPPSYNIFSEYTFTDTYIVLRTVNFSIADVLRVSNNESVFFFYKNTSLVLTYDFEKGVFIWGNFSQNSTVQKNKFILETLDGSKYVDYISEETPLSITIDYESKKYYVTMDEENILSLSNKKSEYKLFLSNKIEKENETIQNIPTEKLLKDRVNYMNTTMKTYLETYFPDKSTTKDIKPTSLKCNSVGKNILFTIVLLLSIYFCILYFWKIQSIS
jgi:hypothetical protein